MFESLGDRLQGVISKIKGYGQISEETLNKSVRRVLEMVYRTIENHIEHQADFNYHSELSKKIACDSAVLLKNKE